MFGSDSPCFHCFCLSGGLTKDAGSDSALEDESELDLDVMGEGGDEMMGRAEAEAASLCAADPKCFTLALDMGEARYEN